MCTCQAYSKTSFETNFDIDVILKFLADPKRSPFLDEFEASQLGIEESEKIDVVTKKGVFRHEDYAFSNLLFSRGISMVLIVSIFKRMMKNKF